MPVPSPRTPSSWSKAAAVYLDRRILLILFLGFSSGLPLALTGTTLSAWLVEGGIGTTQIGLFALAGLPYTFKFAWSPLIDRLRLPWLTRRLGRRRAWAVVTQVALALALLALGATDPVRGIGWTALFSVAVAFCSASQDIVLDAYRVEVLEEHQYGAGAGAMVLGYRLGMIASGAGALYLAGFVPWSTVYAAMAALTAVGLLTVLLNPEPRSSSPEPFSPEPFSLQSGAVPRGLGESGAVPRGPGWRARFLGWLRGAVVAPLADFTGRPAWAAILLFITIYKLGDVYAGHMAMPFYLHLGFTKAEIAGVTKLVGLLATIGGGLAGGILVSRLGIFRSLLVCGLLQMGSNLMFVVLDRTGPDIGVLTLAVAVENTAQGMGTSALVAYLSSLCSVAYTATQYALLSSLTAFGRTFLAAGSGYAAAQTSWSAFFLLCSAAALPGLLLLLWLERVRPREPAITPAAESGAAS